MEEAKFWAVAVAAMVLYGLMVWANYGIPMRSMVESENLKEFIYAITTALWIPSFLAGLVARRRAVLLGILTIVGGTLVAYVFRSLDPISTPVLIQVTLNNPIDWPMRALLSITLSIVACFAGNHVVLHTRETATS